MSFKKTVLQQYRSIVQRAARQTKEFTVPPEGWVRTVRKALAMSGPQLAARVGVSRARISQAEQAELSGGVTLKAMQSMADAVGCRFVYAIVPKNSIEEIVRDQARRKAKALVLRAGRYMALESQTLSDAQMEAEVDCIAEDLIQNMPSDFWTDK